MNNDLFMDGTRILGGNWALILETLICISWGTLLVFAILKKTAKQDFTDTELTALALGGWPLPALLISVPILILLPILPAEIIFILAATLIIISAGIAAHVVWKDITPGVIPPLIIFLILLFLRLGFIANIILPPYFDSAEHYRIIQALLKTEWPTSSYYHLGYHMIVGALTFITHANLAQVMLIFGQAILAAIPLPIFFFIRRATGSNMAALFGVTLAAFGWYMPAHAVNWGKYPALLSLLLIQFTIGAVILKNRWLMTLSVIASVLIHTRTAILFGILGAAWMLSNQVWNKRALLLALAGTMIGMSVLLMDQNQVLGPIFEPYLIWITLPVVLLSALASQSFPQLIIFSSLAILMSLAGIFIPVTSAITLLDRPLVEMILFLPLSFLGGLGVSKLPKFAVPVLAAIVIIHAWTAYNFYPSDCCQLANRNDAAALDWINKRLPADARFAIASADLNLNAFGAPMQSAGADAGIWIVPLTQRTTLSLPYFTDFVLQSAHDLLCDQQVTHIYIGAMPQSFKFVETKPEWYKVIFLLSKTQVVQVTGCGDG